MESTTEVLQPETSNSTMPPFLPLFLFRSEGTSGLRSTCSLPAQTVRTHKAGTSVTPLPLCDCSHPLVSYPLPDLGALQHCLHTDTICSGFGPRAGTAALLGDPEINQNYLDSFITPCSQGYYGIISMVLETAQIQTFQAKFNYSTVVAK